MLGNIYVHAAREYYTLMHFACDVLYMHDRYQIKCEFHVKHIVKKNIITPYIYTTLDAQTSVIRCPDLTYT